MNAGLQTLEWLFREALQVDSEWSVKTPNGFCWWADQNAQTIEIIGEETGPDGQQGYLISIRTEVLRSVALDHRQLEAINDSLMIQASMAGPVYNEETKTLSLASLARTYDHINYWMRGFFSVAAVIQIGEARIIGSELAERLGVELALSGPAGRGLRPTPDEMSFISTLMIPLLGQASDPPKPTLFQQVVDEYMQQPPALLATSSDVGFTVEFPFGDKSSSLCRVRIDMPHPLYGNGLFILQSFPYTAMNDAEGIKLALSMNECELLKRPFGYGFGSYNYHNNMLHFVSFLPNILTNRWHGSSSLSNLYGACALRAQEMSSRLTGVDWTETSFSPLRSPLGRLLYQIQNDRK